MMNMKKLLALLLAIVMVLGMFPVSVFAEDGETPDVIVCENCEAQGHTADTCEACTQCKQTGSHAEGCTLAPLTEGQSCETCGSEEHTTENHPKCGTCGSEEHTTENHPKCGTCGSEEHTTENHPKCGTCGSEEHTTENHPKCGTCGSEEHTTENHPKCGTCGSTEHTEHPAEDTVCSECNQTVHTVECPFYCAFCGQTPCICKVCENPDCGVKNGHKPECPLRPCTVCTDDPCRCEKKCEFCGAELTENTVHAEDCLSKCTCDPKPAEGEGHKEGCLFYDEAEPALSEKLLAVNDLEDLYTLVFETDGGAIAYAAAELSFEELTALVVHVEALYDAIENPTKFDTDSYEMLTEIFSMYIVCPDCGGEGGEHIGDCPRGQLQTLDDKNVYNRTQGTWHSTLFDAVNRAASNAVIEVHKDTVEPSSFMLDGKNLTIKAADNCNVTVTWNLVNEQSSGWYLPNGYSCIYIHANSKVVFGEKGATGSLTLKHTNTPTIYSSTNKAELNGKQPNWATRSARVIMLNGGNMDLHDGVTITGGHPVGSGVENMAGGGILVASGSTLNMDGGTITKNFSLGGTAGSTKVGDINGNDLYRCCIGAGGGVYVRGGGTFNLSGGVISENTSDNGGGGGVAVAPNSTFIMTGGKIKDNVIETSSGGGFASVNGQNTVKISGGEISGNTCPNAGGGIFARGGAVLEITGDLKVFDNEARIGGGVLYWTTGEGTSNKLVISGDVEIYENRANLGAGVYIGREYYQGQIIGKECYFEMKGGKIYENSASTAVAGVVSGFGGGLYAQDNCKVTITGGVIEENYAKDAGGGIYVFSGNIQMSAGTIKNNSSYDGGAFYVAKQETDVSDIAKSFVKISGGTFERNHAENDGGGIYIAEGDVEVSGGLIGGDVDNDANTAKCGGAAYVSGGNFTMSGGAISRNKASTNGGGVYITGGDFTMTSGRIIENKTTDAKSNGGGIYVNDGDIVLGIADCAGTGTNHTNTDNHKIHPLVQNNTAVDSGGGIALIGDGNITMYCGNVIDNSATNRGRGLNIYMENGTFNYHTGDVGALHSPELVIVGGKLNHVGITGIIKLDYAHCNDVTKFPANHTGDLSNKEAEASNGAWINLPDGEKYWEAPTGYRFFGWTFNGPDSDAAKAYVRNKGQYKPLGTPIEVLDSATENYDGNADGTIHMYALWAPEESNITYKGVVIDGAYNTEVLNVTNDSTYKFSITDYTIELNSPSKAGYTFLGWYYYQDEGQNANWGIEPDYKDNSSKDYTNLDFSDATTMGWLPVDADGKCDLLVEGTNFGDITLIAKFEPAYTSLRISKSGCQSIDENQTFIFNISGQPNNKNLPKVDMNVVIQGNGFVQIKELPVGTYTVKEISGWSWRYEAHSDNVGFGADPAIKIVKALDPMVDYAAYFRNDRENPYWLSGDSYKENNWSIFQ